MEKTYVLVADAVRARIFVAAKPKAPLREIEDLVHPEARLHARELTSDSPGRTRDRVGHGRHSLEEPTDSKQAETLAFAHQIAAYFRNLHAREPEASFVLAAGPELLGVLRKQFDETTMQAVAREFDKNLVRLSTVEISKRLGFSTD